MEVAISKHVLGIPSRGRSYFIISIPIFYLLTLGGYITGILGSSSHVKWGLPYVPLATLLASVLICGIIGFRRYGLLLSIGNASAVFLSAGTHQALILQGEFLNNLSKLLWLDFAFSVIFGISFYSLGALLYKIFERWGSMVGTPTQ